MADVAHKDKIFFDHIGQIIINAVLQGVIIGKSEGASSVIQSSVDTIAKAATSEVVVHAKNRLQEIREEIVASGISPF